MSVVKNLPFRVYKYITDPKFKKCFAKKQRIDRSYDIPYVAGYSKNDDVIYIDRHFKKMLKNKNIEKYVILHEKTEKALMDAFDMHYQKAHDIATVYERYILEIDGLDWKSYNKFVMDQYKTIEHEDLKNIPKNLDLTPYKDEKDFEILKRIHIAAS